MKARKFLSVLAAAALLTPCVSTALIADAAESDKEPSAAVGHFTFDPGDWNSTSVLFYIWDESETPIKYATNNGWVEDNTWGSRRLTAGTKLDDGTFQSYDVELPENHNIFVIFYDLYSGEQTYDCVLDKTAFGDQAVRTGELYENPVNNLYTTEGAKFKKSGLTARMCITSSGKVQGESLPPNTNRPFEVAKFILQYQNSYDQVTREKVVTKDTVANAIEKYETTRNDVWKEYQKFKDDEYYSTNYVYNETEAKKVIFPDGEGDPDIPEETFVTDNFKFVYTSSSEISITGYTGSDTKVTIHETLSSLSVTGIGAQAFLNKTAITAITIPNCVTDISDTAFEGCTNLTIYCGSGSVAENYARVNNIPCQLTDSTDAQTDDSAQTLTYYFLNPTNASTTYAYWWTPTMPKAWPGTQMTAAPEIGNNVFKIDVPLLTTGIVFSSLLTSVQTVNIDLTKYSTNLNNVGNKIYVITGTDRTTGNSVGEWCSLDSADSKYYRK